MSVGAAAAPALASSTQCTQVITDWNRLSAKIPSKVKPGGSDTDGDACRRTTVGGSGLLAVTSTLGRANRATAAPDKSVADTSNTLVSGRAPWRNRVPALGTTVPVAVQLHTTSARRVISAVAAHTSSSAAATADPDATLRWVPGGATTPSATDTVAESVVTTSPTATLPEPNFKADPATNSAVALSGSGTEWCRMRVATSMASREAAPPTAKEPSTVEVLPSLPEAVMSPRTTVVHPCITAANGSKSPGLSHATPLHPKSQRQPPSSSHTPWLEHVTGAKHVAEHMGPKSEGRARLTPGAAPQPGHTGKHCAAASRVGDGVGEPAPQSRQVHAPSAPQLPWPPHARNAPSTHCEQSAPPAPG